MKYEYEAMNGLGVDVKGTVEADTSESALSAIRTQGYYPTKLRPVHPQARGRFLQFLGKVRKALFREGYPWS